MRHYDRVDVFPARKDDRPHSQRICTDELFEELQSLVGGFIIAIYPEKRPEYVWIYDEEGIPKQLPKNYHIWNIFKLEMYGTVIEIPRTIWER